MGFIVPPCWIQPPPAARTSVTISVKWLCYRALNMERAEAESCCMKGEKVSTPLDKDGRGFRA